MRGLRSTTVHLKKRKVKKNLTRTQLARSMPQRVVEKILPAVRLAAVKEKG